MKNVILKNLTDSKLLMMLRTYRKSVRMFSGIDNKKSNFYYDKHEKVENELLSRGYVYNSQNIMIKKEKLEEL